MKNNLLLLCILFVTITNAQQPKWRLSAEYGVLGLSAYHDYSIYHDREADVGSNVKNEFTTSGLPAFAVSYQWNEVLAFGISYVYEQSQFNYTQPVGAAVQGQLYRESFENKKRISQYVYTDIYINWGQWQRAGFYSAISLGYHNKSLEVETGYDQALDKVQTYNYHLFDFHCQFLGIRLNHTISPFVEIGFGAKGLVRGGIAIAI